MEHGRDHDEREQKIKQSRRTTRPLDEEAAAEERRATAGHGSEHAPTRQAERHEAERHRREREQGHVAAGTEGKLKADE